jgi:hypothetical protein
MSTNTFTQHSPRPSTPPYSHRHLLNMEARRQQNSHKSTDIVDLTSSPTPSTSYSSNPSNRNPPLLGMKTARPPSSDSSSQKEKSVSHSPLLQSDSLNQASSVTAHVEKPFGSSISKPRNPTGAPSSSAYSAYIKPATPGAFGKKSSQPLDLPNFKKNPPPTFQPRQGPPPKDGGWPSWVTQTESNTKPVIPVGKPAEEGGEFFDIDSVPMSRGDYERYDGDADAHMRELLSGAVGDGEGEPIAEGEDVVDGFTSKIRLMPHQVRGVKWMRGRESGRKYGGILADVSLGDCNRLISRIWVLERLSRR